MIEGRVVAVRHCRDWHRVEHVCWQLRNEPLSLQPSSRERV
jgi:hypothetical protein